MLLLDKDRRSYSYYIDVSLDGVQYKRLIDCTAYYCRSWQYLYFPPRPVQFIKLVGTRVIGDSGYREKFCSMAYNGVMFVSDTNTFGVVGLEAMYIEGRKITNDFLRATFNVADTKYGAMVIEGAGGSNMLNDNLKQFTCHEIGEGLILLQLNQPYYISSLRMLLGTDKNNTNQYSFFIETSLDNENWQLAVDKRDESLSGWQQFQFEERPVVFVKIVGTQFDIVSIVFL